MNCRDQLREQIMQEAHDAIDKIVAMGYGEEWAKGYVTGLLQLAPGERKHYADMLRHGVRNLRISLLDSFGVPTK